MRFFKFLIFFIFNTFVFKQIKIELAHEFVLTPQYVAVRLKLCAQTNLSNFDF